MKDSTKAAIVRSLLFACIIGSVWMMYYVNIIKRDYIVFTNPEGPILSE